jgi:hypothetical protein
MMKYILCCFLIVFAFSCSNKEAESNVDHKIILKADTINLVKLSDTLVIYESTCRGCAYEASTTFAVSDSMNIIKLADVITTDNNSSDMAGGSVSKKLILVPLKKGNTAFKLYKFWSQQTMAKDSANFATYKIEVQ